MLAMIGRLEVRATQQGEWVAPTLHERRGGWLERGQPLGELVDRSHFRFSAVLPQSQAAELFGLPQAQGELRLMSDRGRSLPVEHLRLLPYQRDRLVSPVLGFGGGGDVAVRPDDTTGTMTTEPFFEIHAELPDQALAQTVAYHGMAGVLRVPVPPRPLAERGRAALQQLLQQRYAL
jgi:putative peptide zinc metalloprotease protein